MRAFTRAKQYSEKKYAFTYRTATKVRCDLELIQSEVIEDWYTICRVKHANRSWFERTRFGHRLMCASRLSPEACVEGTREHMLGIARAILNKKNAYYKRCAVEVGAHHVYLWSPRNSVKNAVVKFSVAKKFATTVLPILEANTLYHNMGHNDQSCG